MGAVAPWCGSTTRKTKGRAAAPSGALDSGANTPLVLQQIPVRRRRGAEGSFFSCFFISSGEFLPVASGGSCVIARLGNKVGNVHRPSGGDLSFSATGYEPLADWVPSLKLRRAFTRRAGAPHPTPCHQRQKCGIVLTAEVKKVNIWD